MRNGPPAHRAEQFAGLLDHDAGPEPGNRHGNGSIVRVVVERQVAPVDDVLRLGVGDLDECDDAVTGENRAPVHPVLGSAHRSPRSNARLNRFTYPKSSPWTHVFLPYVSTS